MTVSQRRWLFSCNISCILCCVGQTNSTSNSFFYIANQYGRCKVGPLVPFVSVAMGMWRRRAAAVIAANGNASITLNDDLLLYFRLCCLR